MYVLSAIGIVLIIAKLVDTFPLVTMILGLALVSVVPGLCLLGFITDHNTSRIKRREWQSIWNNYAKFLDVLSNDELTYILKSSLKSYQDFKTQFQVYQKASLTVNISRGLQSLGYDFGTGIYLQYWCETFYGSLFNVCKVDNNEHIGNVYVVANKDKIAIFNDFSLSYREETHCDRIPSFILKEPTIGETVLNTI